MAVAVLGVESTYRTCTSLTSIHSLTGTKPLDQDVDESEGETVFLSEKE